MSTQENIILYVDDDSANRSLVRKVLSAEGFVVIEAEDGISGIDTAKRENPELILMDMNMPGLDGYEASTLIKALPEFKDVPIIALTANAMPGDKERSLIAGCDGYITKPFDLDTFSDEIHAYLRGKKEHVKKEEQENYYKEYSGKLVERLEKKVRELTETNTELEQRVNDQVNELQSANEQLLQSEKMASIGQLAAGVAHEINNPVGFVTSNITTLGQYLDDLIELLNAYAEAEKKITDNDVLNNIKSIKDRIDIGYLKKDIVELLAESTSGVQRVKKIVQDLKDFSRVDSTEWEWVDIHNGIESTLNIVNNEIKYQADVIKEYGPLPEIECVSSQLNQVFVNLLVNAAQAMEERGTITIKTGLEDNENIWISVSDTGSGIPEDVAKRIFEPFYTTKPLGKGTGLGLSISYGIITKHGGRFELDSKEGQGTTFKIILPIKQPVEESEK